MYLLFIFFFFYCNPDITNVRIRAVLTIEALSLCAGTTAFFIWTKASDGQLVSVNPDPLTWALT